MTAVPTDARFTAEQRAALERIEAAPDAEESWEARVAMIARAINRALDSDDPNDWMPRGLAVAVAAAVTPQTDRAFGPGGLPTENARLYAREFASVQLRSAARWCEANGYDDAAVDHLIVKAQELWP